MSASSGYGTTDADMGVGGFVDNWGTFGTAANAGRVAGVYDAGKASRWQAIGAGALFAGAIVAAGGSEGKDVAEADAARGLEQLIANAGKLKYTVSTTDHLLKRPFMNSVTHIQEIMRARSPIPDPGGIPGGLRWDVPGAFGHGWKSISEGTWELVIDPIQQLIVHHNFVGN